MLDLIHIETDHLLAIPLEKEQLELYLQKSPSFEENMGFQISSIFISDEVEELLREAVLPRFLRDDTEIYWFTNWVVIERKTQKVIGDFCFYDYPDAQGLVELGYGMYPAHQNKGFMSELMQGIIEWVKKQEHVRYIRARTEQTNLASVKLLSKSGFMCPNEEEPIQFWYYIIDSSKVIER